MFSPFNVFVETIHLGEKLFGLSYSDYHDAYSYSEKYFSPISEHFIDHFDNHSDRQKGTYEYNLTRYIFIKAIEHRIASDLFSSTSRGNVCDVFRSPFDIDLDSFPTNLPKHLEVIVNEKRAEASQIADAVMGEVKTDKDYCFGVEVLNAVQFIGQTIGYHIGKKNAVYKGYQCSEMLTRNELNEIAGTNLCKWLVGNGFEIEGANFTRDTIQNIIATKGGAKVFVLLSAEIAPVDPVFIPLDLDNLYNAALAEKAVPYYASVSLASADNAHFNDGVILYGDQTRFRVNAIGELEAEE